MDRHDPIRNRKNAKKGNKAHNIFALITNNRQDRSWRGMRELYHFNSNVELAEYSLPIISDDKDADEDKLQPGVVNVDGVHMKMGTKANKLDPLRHPSKSQATERQILEEAEEDMEEMDEDGQYEEDHDKSLDSDELEDMLNAVDDKAENEIALAKNSMFIEKGTPLYKQRAEIKTGEQAISFFAKHGNNTPIKIFNCNRAKVPPGVFRPYDLEVVLDEKQLNEEYFTISNRGVVHVFKKNTKRMRDEEMVPTEFLFASDWMHEATLFNVLSSMKFFKNYLIGKVFNNWKANVRYKRFIRTRQKLAQNLKYMRPAFQSCFMEINGTLYEMQKVKCFKELKPNKTYKLEEDFIPDQKKGREDAKNHYENKITEITNRLIELTNEVTESKNIRDEEDFENSKIGQKVKHKAMTVQKKEEQTKRDVLKIAKKNISNLGTFIRLVDYMVVESQVKINQEGADMVYAEMSTEDRKAGINSDITYDTEGMAFNPPEGEFVQQFERMLNEMVAATNDITRIINNHHFTQYTQNIVSDSGPRFREIVDDSEDYKLIKNKITQKFIDDFAQLHRDAAKFEDCRIVSDFFTTFNFQEFKRANHDLHTIQERLEQLRKWETKIATSIKAQIIRGVIYGNGKTLRDNLSKMVRENLQAIRSYLEELTLEKQQDVIDRLKKISKGLKSSMGTLTEYVEYVKNLQDAKQELSKLEQEKSTVEMMMGILKKSNKSKDINSMNPLTPASGEATVQFRYENILTELASCHKQINEKEAEVNGLIEEKVAELDKSIGEVKERMRDIIDKVDRDKLTEASTPSEEALKELVDRIKNKFDPLRKTANYNKDAQKILGQQVTSIEEIEDFDRKWEARHKLWRIRHDWDVDYNTWFNETFQGQDAQETEKKIKEYEKDLTWLKQNLPRDKKDEVLEKLVEDIRGSATMKDLILDLGNKALQERHWIKIFSLLPDGNQYAPSRVFYLNELIRDGILEVKDKVGEISGIASGEYAISQALEEIKKVWATMEFIIVPYRDFKDKFILGSIEEIMIQLEDDQVSIQTMLSSKNVKEIREEVT